MPNIKSAKKRVLVNDKKKAQNKAAVSEIKTAIKKFKDAVAAGDKANAEVLFKNAVSLIDAARLDGVYHQNAASRYQSQLAKELNKLN